MTKKMIYEQTWNGNVLQLPFVPKMIMRVGSSAMPATRYPKDYDFLVLCGRFPKMISNLIDFGYQAEESLYSDTDFLSFRKDKMNVILTDDKKFYEKFGLATRLCQALGVTTREERLIIHKAILYGECTPTPYQTRVT